MNALTSTETEKILAALRQAKGYVTLPYLSNITGSPRPVLEQYVLSHPEKFRKSRISTDEGLPLFMQNTPMSGIADAWNSFRYVNAKKF
jgi:hypothetical protein